MGEIVRNLILVRHAETLWNREGRFQGHLDSRVTLRGVEQIQAVARRLQDTDVDVVFTSDLGRSILTADRIARAVHAPVVVDVRLRERNHGLFEGLTHELAQERYPELVQQIRAASDSDFAVPSAESKRQLLGRTLEAIEVAVGYPGRANVVVIGHGGLLRVFLNYVLQQPIHARNGYVVRNCSVSAVTYDRGRWHAENIGDAHHLDGLA